MNPRRRRSPAFRASAATMPYGSAEPDRCATGNDIHFTAQEIIATAAFRQ